MNSLWTTLLLITALLCNAAANLLVKYGMARRARLEETGGALAGPLPWVAQFLDPYFALGILCFGLNLVAYSLALKHLRLSLAYPIMVSGGYAIILLVGWMVFREKLTPVQFGGVGLMLIGLWMAVR